MNYLRIVLLVGLLHTLAWGVNPIRFLTYPQDAASLALAGATQALPIGTMDFFRNPALSDLRSQIGFGVSNIIEYEQFQYAALAMTIPLKGNGTFGWGIVGLFYPGMTRYDETGMALGDFSQYNAAFVVNYSKVLLPFAVGANIKYVQRGFTGLDKNPIGKGIGIDLGMYYNITQQLKLAVVYRLGFQLSWEEGYIEKIPKAIDVGVAWHPTLLGRTPFGFVFNIHQEKNEPVKANLGIRWVLAWQENETPKMAVYGGIGQINFETRTYQVAFQEYFASEKFYSTGVSLRIGTAESANLVLDYSFWMHPVLPNRHMITTKIEF